MLLLSFSKLKTSFMSWALCVIQSMPGLPPFEFRQPAQQVRPAGVQHEPQVSCGSVNYQKAPVSPISKTPHIYSLRYGLRRCPAHPVWCLPLLCPAAAALPQQILWPELDSCILLLHLSLPTGVCADVYLIDGICRNCDS